MSEHSADIRSTTPTGRQRRKTAKLAKLVERWLATIPESDRRDYYSAAEITTRVGKPSKELAPALRALGWHNVQVRLPEFNGKPGAIWVRPGGRSPKRGIGRPRRIAAARSYQPASIGDRDAR